MDKYARFRYQPCIPLGADGRKVTGSPEHAALSRKAAGEGMVLLKNRLHTLPLTRGTRVALFGKATIEYKGRRRKRRRFLRLHPQCL